jgi:hypothetical protein
MSHILHSRRERIANWFTHSDHAVARKRVGVVLALITVLALVILALVLVWIVPRWEVVRSMDAALQASREKQLALENEFRKTLTQIVLSIFGLFILYFTWQRARAGDKTVQIMEQGHITDRYTKAIDQLGKLDGDKPNIEVRLGAIYALERIAHDSPRDHWTIMEVLTAYVRQNAPAARSGDDFPKTPPPEYPRTDIHAILTVLGRRPTGPRRERADQKLDLSHTHLQYANLHHTNLNNATFMYSNLENAILLNAKLRGVWFLQAHLRDTNFIGADLQGADFNGAKLDEASLGGADLRDTMLGNADLRTARGLEQGQVKAARLWEDGHYSPEFRAKLGLPPENTQKTPRSSPHTNPTSTPPP